jgi:hypothetical protein
MKQATLDIGFRKEEGRYSEKARALGPSSPSPGGQARVLSEATRPNHFVVGRFEFLPRLQRRAGQRRKLERLTNHSEKDKGTALYLWLSVTC